MERGCLDTWVNTLIEQLAEFVGVLESGLSLSPALVFMMPSSHCLPTSETQDLSKGIVAILGQQGGVFIGVLSCLET